MKQVIQPGASLVEAGRALETRRRGLGAFPYQWIFPGPNARPVLANGSALAPDPVNTVVVVTYEVPQGFLFSLRAIALFGFTSSTWNEGTGDVTWSLIVTGPAPRTVEFFTDVKTHLGSMTNPFPIMGRLEFQPLDIVEITVTVNATVVAGPPNAFSGVLAGHRYPQSEAA